MLDCNPRLVESAFDTGLLVQQRVCICYTHRIRSARKLNCSSQSRQLLSLSAEAETAQRKSVSNLFLLKSLFRMQFLLLTYNVFSGLPCLHLCTLLSRDKFYFRNNTPPGYHRLDAQMLRQHLSFGNIFGRSKLRGSSSKSLVRFGFGKMNYDLRHRLLCDNEPK